MPKTPKGGSKGGTKVAGLTADEERFCLELLKPGGNQSSAYREVFPRSRKWANKTVWEKASTLAAKPVVKARIAALRSQFVTQPGVMELQEAMLTLSHIARADLRKCFNADGTLKNPSDVDDHTAIAMVAFELDKAGGTVKLASKIEAVKEILRHYSMRMGLPPPPEVGKVVDEERNAYDWARRVAYTLQNGMRLATKTTRGSS